MGMGVGPGRGIKSDINVTPLVDVVLVLLIIFMVVTPMLQRGKDVKLPPALKVEAEKKGGSDPIIVSVTTDKKIWIETDAFDEAKFEEALRDKLQAEPGKRILLKGDQTLAFEDVRRVMSLARKAGAKAVFLGVEEIKK